MPNLRVQPFRALTPQPEFAAEFNCVPYDVVSTEEARALAHGKPRSLLHVDRAEIGLPDDTDPHDDIVYLTAASNFTSFKTNGTLRAEPAAAIFLYRQQMGSHVQTGIAAVCHVEDYDADIIKKHEKTRKDKEDDRTRLIDTISCNTGPIFLTFQDDATLASLIEKETQTKPLYQFTAEDGVTHTVWKATENEPIVAAFANLPCAYIADGHHRAASAARVARSRREKNPNHTGAEAYNWFLCVLFPASHLKVLAYNRAVSDLNGHTPDSLLNTLQQKGIPLQHAAPPAPKNQGEISIYTQGKWYGIQLQPAPDADPVSRLDVSLLQDHILDPILAIGDPRTSQRITFIGGARGTQELEKLVDSGKAAAAFSMYPTTVHQMMDIADAGQIMPPKSTWFEPKLRSGFFLHNLEGNL